MPRNKVLKFSQMNWSSEEWGDLEFAIPNSRQKSQGEQVWKIIKHPSLPFLLPSWRKNLGIMSFLTEIVSFFSPQGTQTRWRRSSLLWSCWSETWRQVGHRLWLWLLSGSCQCAVQRVTVWHSHLHPRGSSLWRRQWTDLGWRIPVWRAGVPSFTLLSSLPARWDL